MVIVNRICIIFSVFFLSFNCTYASDLEESVPQMIAHHIKQSLTDISDSDVLKLTTKHFTKMGLRDKDQWIDPSLDVIPVHHTRRDLETLVDHISQNVQDNPYLMDVLTKAPALFCPKPQKETADFLSYAMSLDQLTLAMRRDVSLLKKVIGIWDNKIGNHPFQIYRKAGLLFLIKYYSVRAPLVNFVKAFDAGHINPDFSRYMLPLNILEASLVDYATGYQGNAMTGWTLAKNRPGNTTNLFTGSGPTSFSQDCCAAQVRCPFPREWAHLYTTWNLGFVSAQTRNPLYWSIKLLIPSVSGYQKSPTEYIHNRTLALYATLNYALEMYSDNDENLLSTQFSTPEIAKVFNTVNPRNAQIYADKINNTGPLDRL